MMKKLLFILFAFCIQHSAFSITPVFTCGAECGISAIHFTLSSSASYSTTQKRSGDRALRCNPSAGAGYFTSPTFSANAIWVIRFYVYFTSLPTANNSVIAGVTTLACIRYKTADGKFYAAGSTIETGALGVTLSTGQFYRIDLKVDMTNNPWTIDMSVDGVAYGQATHAAAGSTSTTFTLGTFAGAGATYDAYYDDVVSSNTSGDFPIGAGYVNHFVPTADGTHAANITTNDFERTTTGTDILNSTTDSYLLLDDVPLESGASVDWINMVAPVANSYTENIFGPATGISTPTTAPRFASFIIGIHAAGTGAYNAAWELNDNGTTASIFTASAIAGVTSVIYKTLDLSDPPSAASSWTLSGNGNFNDIRIRFNSTASVDANPDVYFDCAMIEAEFEEVNATVPGTPSDKRHTTLGVGSLAATESRVKNFIK